MRIVSLLPGATEMVYALGRGDDLVARSPECDFPPEVQRKPVASRGVIDPELGSAAIDATVEARIRSGVALYAVDEAILQRLRPDLVLTQAVCEVCAPSLGEVREVTERLAHPPEVLSFDAHELAGIFEGLERLGDAVDAPEAARALASGLRARVEAVRSRRGSQRPSVACLEWFDPIFAAGHWVPEQVESAGGREVLGRTAAPSAKVDWDRVLEADPEHLVLMPCGMDVPRGQRELPTLRDRPGWRELRAVRAGHVWLVNGSAYFSRPGPRVVPGIEILERLLHANGHPLPKAGDAIEVR